MIYSRADFEERDAESVVVGEYLSGWVHRLGGYAAVPVLQVLSYDDEDWIQFVMRVESPYAVQSSEERIVRVSWEDNAPVIMLHELCLRGEKVLVLKQ